MKYFALVLFIACLSTSSVLAQPYFKEAVQLPTLSNTFIDVEGNVLQTGSYVNSPDFDKDGEPDLENRGGADIYLSSHTKEGTLNWVMSAGGSTESVYETGGGVVVGVDGQIYVAGTFEEGADFDGDGVNDVVASPPVNTALFLAQYNPDGTFNWVKKLDNLTGFVRALVYAPATGLLYLSGFVFDEINNAAGTGSMYVAALDNEGAILWQSHTTVNGESVTGNVEPYSLAVDNQGTLFLSGTFRGEVDFDGDGPLMPVSTSSTTFGPQARAFVASYNATGQINWIQYADGNASSFANGVAIDDMNNVYITGSYGLGAVVFQDETDTFTGPEPADNMFLAKYDAAGDLQWATFPNAYVDFLTYSAIYGSDLAVDPDGTAIYVGGFATGFIDFDLDGTFDINTFNYPAYTVAYTSEGSADWHWTGGSDASVNKVLSDAPGTFRLLGDFINTIDFDGAGAASPMVVFGGSGRGYFLADFNLIDDTIPVELTSFTATADGNTALLSWTTASEINNAGFEILHHRGGGRAIQESPRHIDAFIPGAGTTTEPQTYTYTFENLTPGTHYFQLKQIDFDGAFTLSEAISLSINLDGIYQLSSAYPNPFNPQATFSLSVAQTQEVEIALYDLLGRRVQSIFKGSLQTNTPHAFVIDGSGLPSGTYIYRVDGQRFTRSERVILLK